MIPRQIEEILESKSTIFSQVTSLMTNINEENLDELKVNISKVQVISEEFDDLLHKVWKKLMNSEIILHEQLEVNYLRFIRKSINH